MTDLHSASTAGTAGTVLVPELIGMPAADAHDSALDAGLLAVPDNAVHTAAGRGRIEGQDPDPGARVDRGATVRIRIGT